MLTFLAGFCAGCAVAITLTASYIQALNRERAAMKRAANADDWGDPRVQAFRWQPLDDVDTRRGYLD